MHIIDINISHIFRLVSLVLSLDHFCALAYISFNIALEILNALRGSRTPYIGNQQSWPDLLPAPSNPNEPNWGHKITIFV